MAIRSSWSQPQSAPGLLFADSIELLHFWQKEYNQSDFGIAHLVMSMCRVFSCVVWRGCLLWPVCSPGKTLLAFALLHSIFQSQVYLFLQVFLDFLLLHSRPLKWKGHLSWMLVLKGQGQWPSRATPNPRSRVEAGQSYPTPKARGSGSEEISIIQGKEQWLRFAGAAMKRYPTSKVRET